MGKKMRPFFVENKLPINGFLCGKCNKIHERGDMNTRAYNFMWVYILYWTTVKALKHCLKNIL